ncbi:hypothetical protein GCM10011380_10620 [Sphingomonas metalli]|uniref:DUF4139 domain-containing protein n=1 Tax=Sphingomonas metalli TaxID=1779358 RepID=A0A916WRI8_9SPHN|nr:hypothetical protein [Sphingomonas metalli]GGB22830.1 hypothetical protein GCM10011380_10620 [Sphingomonas metalli]
MLRRLLAAAILAMAVVATPLHAEPVTVTSAAPDRVSLTVYRGPDGSGAMNLRFLQGFALVTETRRIRLPRGTAVVRFEGVAEGIVSVSAIIDGLPGGTIEKNRDARLLSPASLVDGTLGRRITLTRTDKATGRAVSEEATIVAGPRPGVIVQTAAGIEALRCSGLPEQLGYAGVPAGLSSKPVLSVTTTSSAAATVTVRLTYLASGFDWRASYVATLAPDGRALDLFAWMTLANGNDEVFPQAEVQAVAGRLNRVAVSAIPQEASALRLVCYPLGTTTSDLRARKFEPAEPIEPADEIVVTAMNMATLAPPAPPPPPAPAPEDLGDLKLYRIPVATTVAARAQKQVALLAQRSVPFERRYRRAVHPGERIDAASTAIVLMLKNEKTNGLGVPLPAGSTALYARRADERLLLGLGAITDRSVGETFRLAAGVSSQVTVTQVDVAPRDPLRVTRIALGSREAMLTVSNATPFAVRLDVPIGAAGQQIEAEAQDVGRIEGVVTWSPTLAPGGQAELRYRY